MNQPATLPADVQPSPSLWSGDATLSRLGAVDWSAMGR